MAADRRSHSSHVVDGPNRTRAAASSGRSEGVAIDTRIGGLELLQQEYEVAGQTLRMVCPRDPDEVLDRYIEAGTDGDPYWTRVWPAAIALAHELLQRPELVRGLRVADLGAGLGVAGIAAAIAGAKEVVLLDREPLALQCALLSARATGLSDVEDPSRFDTAAGPSPSNQQRAIHSEGSTEDRASGGSSGGDRGMQAAGALRAVVFDWSRPPSLPRFDVVMACDVLYESDAVDPIAEVVPKLLKSTSGLLLLADPPNRTAQNRERFLGLLRQGSALFRLDECYEHSCMVNQLDPELRGGVRGETVPVQFHALRRVVGNDTVGIKPSSAGRLK